LRLFPQDPSDLAISCTCNRHASRPMYAMPSAGAVQPVVEGETPAAAVLAAGASAPTPASPFCKHVCCVMALLAEKLSRDPFLIFQLRGLAKEDLLERLRQKRALAAA